MDKVELRYWNDLRGGAGTKGPPHIITINSKQRTGPEVHL